jgi:hypothetical protein
LNLGVGSFLVDAFGGRSLLEGEESKLLSLRIRESERYAVSEIQWAGRNLTYRDTLTGAYIQVQPDNKVLVVNNNGRGEVWDATFYRKQAFGN